MSGSTIKRSRTDAVGMANPLRFTLVGERMEDMNSPNLSTTGGAYSLKAVGSAQSLNGGDAAGLLSCSNCMVTVLSESMLDHCKVWRRHGGSG